jgi:hypothetical protein
MHQLTVAKRRSGQFLPRHLMERAAALPEIVLQNSKMRGVGKFRNLPIEMDFPRYNAW